MSEGHLSNTCIFSVKYTTTFLRLGTLASTSALRLGATLNSKNTNKKKHKQTKNHGTKYETAKRTLVYSMSTETRRQRVALFDLS